MKNSLPENISAEKAILGAAIFDAKIADRILELLRPEHFTFPAHQTIFETIFTMRQTATPVDIVILSNALEKEGVLEKVGGAAYVTELFTECLGTQNWDYYADIVIDAYKRRAMRQAALTMAEAASDITLSTDDAQERCEQILYALRDDATRENPVAHCKNAIVAAVDQLEVTYQRRGEPIGLTTGLHDLDRCTGGFLGGQMVVIAARPSCGKSALGMQIALHLSLTENVPVLFFSTEMPSKDLMIRSICSQANIDLQRTRDGFFRANDMNTISTAASRLAKSPLFIDDTPGLTVAQLRSRARRAKTEHKIGLIVVDYLQRMHGSSKRASESRALEVSEISESIKTTAMELNIPIIALSQLNRDAEESAKPKLAHLRESGSIEQDADIVFLIHRLDRNKKRDAETEPPMDHNTLLLVEKNRNGPPAEIKLNFIGNQTTFMNLTEKIYSNNQSERQK